MSPDILFLPGAGADPDFWRPVGERLPGAGRRLYLGWPGLGAQPPDPAVNGIEDLVGLVEARMGHAPVDLVAQSLGGLIAMLVTLRDPTRVRRLVLTVTSAGLPMDALGARPWRETYRRAWPKAAPWVGEPTPDLSPALGGVVQPTLLIWGDADPISPVAVGRRLASLLPDARLEILPAADHDLAVTHAEAVARLIARHLA